MEDLRAKLLTIGGEHVNEVYEEDLKKLLTRGVLFNDKITVVKMKQSRCHENSAVFYSNYSSEHGIKAVSIVTGWVLEKGKWYQHSWVRLTKGNKIVETTHKREAYFGFILSDEEAEDFCYDNY